jgi:hypothetical protein
LFTDTRGERSEQKWKEAKGQSITTFVTFTRTFNVPITLFLLLVAPVDVGVVVLVGSSEGVFIRRKRVTKAGVNINKQPKNRTMPK